MIKNDDRRFFAVLAGLTVVSLCVNWKVFAGDKDASNTPDVVRARSFELIDDEGKVRARLGFGKDSPGPRLELLDEDYKTSMTIFVDDAKSATGLAIMDQHGSAVLTLGYVGVASYLQLFREAGTSKSSGLQLTASKTVPPNITVFDGNGHSASMGPFGVDQRQTSRPAEKQDDKSK